MISEPGKLLRIYVNERDQFNGQPLYEAIVTRCRELKLAGVTVFRGLEGFGETSELHRAHFFGHDQPIVITIIEQPDRAREALPALQEMMPSGVIAVTEVEVITIAKNPSEIG